jgi:hypothetical protein
MLLSEFARRETTVPLEEFDEIRRLIKTKPIGNC